MLVTGRLPTGGLPILASIVCPSVCLYVQYGSLKSVRFLKL